MCWQYYYCLLMTLGCLVDLLLARPLSSELGKNEPMLSEEVLSDILNLHKLLKFCSTRQKICSDVENIEIPAHRELHRLGFNRHQIYRILHGLRMCIDNPTKCDLEKTILEMESTATDSNSGIEKKSLFDDLKTSFAPNSLDFPHLRKHGKFRNLYSRLGKRFGRPTVAPTRVRRSISNLRARRTVIGQLIATTITNQARKACQLDPDCELYDGGGSEVGSS